MNEQLTNYVNRVFAPYDGVKSVAELKADLLSDLQERFRELKAKGKDDETAFESCIFIGVDFTYSDLRGLRLNGQTFIGVKFDEAALREAPFQGATLKNVSFRSAYTWSKKYYRAMKSINFDGAMMDKLTYAALKGMEADVSKVTVLS
jgi:uncharacterized protein YjbI with pentapeptide repeats